MASSSQRPPPRARLPLIERLELRQLLALTGAIWTTNFDASVVNGNIYDSAGTDVQANKMTVYLNGGPKKVGAAGLNPNSTYYVRVTDPSGKNVLGSSVYLNKTLHSDADGELPLTRLWDIVDNYGQPNKTTGNLHAGFLDTPNPGGEYKVWVSLVSTFDPNQSKTDNFKVRPPRGMHGHKFHDHNGNGLQDLEDEPLDGILVFLDSSNGKPKNGALEWADANANGIWDSGEGEQWTTTSTMGEWSIVPPAAGTYSPREISPPGWLRASLNPDDVVLGTSDKKFGGRFGNFKKINISGIKFNDRNNNGSRDSGEGGLGGITIQLCDKNGNVIATTTTASDGSWSFSNVGPGTVQVKEVVPAGSVQSTPSSGMYVINTRSGEDQTGLLFGNHTSILGRMTGGGSTFTSSGVRVTHGFQIHSTQPPQTVNNRLQINWAKKRFHLLTLTKVDGMDSANIDQGQPAAPIDTIYGEGYGWYNGKTPAGVKFTFVDAGEPGVNDTAKYFIYLDGNNNHAYDSGETVVLNTGPSKLVYGNHQAHYEVGANSAAAQIQQQIDVDFAQLDHDNMTDSQVLAITAELLKLFDQYEAALLA
jgi:hypothetical protein